MSQHQLATAQPLRLYTFSLSHFSEKIRWSCAAAGVSVREVPWTPFFHVMPALLSGFRTTVPILETEAGRVQDSTKILLWLEQHRAPFKLLPSEPQARALALAIEARFDKVGEHVVRYAYNDTLQDTENVIRYWTLDSTPFQKSVVRNCFPMMRVIFRNKLRLNPKAVVRSRRVIEDGLDWLEAHVSAERPYLVGDSLSIADITAAALLAPLVCPDEHPVYSSARYRAGVAPSTAVWQSRPAFDWVRKQYREQRGAFPNAAHIAAALA